MKDWRIRIAGRRGTQYWLSPLVVIAAVVVLVVLGLQSGRQRNSDLPYAALIGFAIWISGWIIQVAALSIAASLSRSRVSEVTIGLAGPVLRPQVQTPRQAVLCSVSLLGSLCLLGLAYSLVARATRESPPFPADHPWWQAPGLGSGAGDSIWSAAVWLCGIQTICQLYPLSGTAGRQLIGALSHALLHRRPRRAQVVAFRRCLILVAIATLVGTAASFQQSAGTNLMEGLMFLAAVLLWSSVYRSDVEYTISAMALANDDRLEPAWQPPANERVPQPLSRQPEHDADQQAPLDEAVDSERLDEILARLHADGRDSLSAVDLQILDRVSESLRRRQQDDQERPHGPE